MIIGKLCYYLIRDICSIIVLLLYATVLHMNSDDVASAIFVCFTTGMLAKNHHFIIEFNDIIATDVEDFLQ